MISKLSHSSIYVLDQQSAKDFYVNKLGFTVKMEIPIGENAYWLTVSPKDQKEIELTLMPIAAGGMFDSDTASTLAHLVKKGIFGFGVFECVDINATYTELIEKGVEFTKKPTKEFYGTEALLKTIQEIGFH